MAATGKTPILLYGSTTATNAPVAGNLTNSSDGCEIAINVADKNLFFKDSTNAVNKVPIRQSSASSNGWLSSTDWSTFNSKVSSQWTTSGSTIYYNTGGVGIGGTAPAGDILYIPKSITGATTSYGVRVQGSVQSDVTDNARIYQSAIGTAAASFTLTNLTHFQAIQTTIGAGSTVTNQYGFNAAGSLTGATNNYGFYSNIASATGRWNFYAAGTADNYMAGNLAFASGKGIDFSATAGTGTSELLADYEEGTWTPSVTAGTGSITTVGAVVGTYTKIGRQVTIWSTITVTTNGTGASYLNVTGIPYTPSTAISHYTSAGTNTSTVKTVNSYLLSGGTIRLWYYDGTYPIASGQTIAFCISYYV